MSELGHAFSFRDWVVYKKARLVAMDLFEVTKTFPGDERFSLTDQVRRSSRSIGAQIAEAWAKRQYEKHFISKLTDADGEQQETQHWIETAWDCDYITKQQADTLTAELSEIGRMLASMIQKSASFCSTPSNRIREEQAEYFITNN